MKKIVKFLNIVFTIIVIIGVSTQVMASTPEKELNTKVIDEATKKDTSTLGKGLNSTVLDEVTNDNDTLFNKLSSPINKVYGSFMLICKILGAAGVVVNGVRYMYASSNDKAKIKQSLIFVVIGTIFIFAADVIIKIVTGSWGDISNGLI